LNNELNCDKPENKNDPEELSLQSEQLQKLREFTLKTKAFPCIDLEAVFSKNEEILKAIYNQKLGNVVRKYE
jgi:hypothetical protein